MRAQARHHPLGQISVLEAAAAQHDPLLPDAKVGDYVLVHAGFAISVLDEAEALETLEYFRQMGELEDKAPEDKA